VVSRRRGVTLESGKGFTGACGVTKLQRGVVRGRVSFHVNTVPGGGGGGVTNSRERLKRSAKREELNG